MWADDLFHLVWVGNSMKKARGIKLCRNMHILDCYSLFEGPGRTGQRLEEMILEKND